MPPNPMPEDYSDLKTNIQLLAQRVSITEKHLNRLGDSSRTLSTDIQQLRGHTESNDRILDHRLQQIGADIEETHKRLWMILIGLIGTAFALLLEFIIKK